MSDVIKQWSSWPEALAYIDKLEKENAILAAHQCKSGYGDERGHFKCKEIEELIEIIATKDRLINAGLDDLDKAIDLIRKMEAEV